MKTIPSKLLFLGSGGSLGIPVIACPCEVCHSNHPKNKRLRPSVLLKIGEKTILIDCGPDFRTQALTHDIKSLDGVILTHSHYDHSSGVDELRVFHIFERKPLACLLSDESLKDLIQRYYYIFGDDNKNKLTTKFDLTILPHEQGEIDWLNLHIKYFSYEQAGMQVNGFRFGNLAYVTDIRNYKDTIFSALQGLDVLILSALRFTPSPLHLSVDEAVAFANQCQAKQTWLTHISHELEHDRTNAYLPENIRLAYDGLEISFNAGLS